MNIVDNNSALCAALVGEGISLSLTPAMQETEGREHGLNYSYKRIDTDTGVYQNQPLSAIIERAQADGFVGLNITHPYKIEVLQYLDDYSDDVRMLGAANTIVFCDDKKIGHNTDISGFAESFRQELGSVEKDRVLLLGAGGAGAAVAFALINCGILNLIIYDINTDQAKALAANVQVHFPLANISSAASLDKFVTAGLCGVVNATPMGTAKFPGTAFPADMLSPEIWVADIVYFPLETELLAKAHAIGCRLMSGSGMAVFQAVHAFELFTGLPANPDRFIKTFAQLIDRKTN